MFRELHARSLSEASSPHESYELTATSSPPPDSTFRSTYLGTPPMSQKEMIPDVVASNAEQQRAELQTPKPPPHPVPVPSPQFSYYSASDIPPPSLLEAGYQYTSVTHRPNSRATSPPAVATSSHTPPPTILPNPFPNAVQPRQRLSPPPMMHSQDLGSPSLLYHETGGSGRKNSEVDRATSPRLSVYDPDRPGTGLSYRTADYMTAEDGDLGDAGNVPRTSTSASYASAMESERSGSAQGWRESRELEQPTPRQSQFYNGDEDEDAATIVGQRDSVGWGIGRAV